VKPSPSKHDAMDPAKADDDFGRPADDAPLTPEERTRLLTELEAEFEAAERSIREEGAISAEELKRHLDALFEAWAEEEAAGRDRTA
jgi:hypothetical protein